MNFFHPVGVEVMCWRWCDIEHKAENDPVMPSSIMSAITNSTCAADTPNATNGANGTLAVSNQTPTTKIETPHGIPPLEPKHYDANETVKPDSNQQSY